MEKTVLLIDDDEEEFLILNEAADFVNVPLYCVWANSAHRAIELLGDLSPDLIMIDYNMPEMNGIDCLGLIRQQERLNSVPIVLYSNADSTMTQPLAAAHGIICVPKSGTVEQLAGYLNWLVCDEGPD